MGSGKFARNPPTAMPPTAVPANEVSIRSGALEQSNVSVVGRIAELTSVTRSFEALQKGQVEGVIYDLAVAQNRVEKSDGELRMVETVPTGEQYGIAFAKDSDLVEPVNQALAEIKADGTYEEIYERWIGVPPEEIP